MKGKMWAVLALFVTFGLVMGCSKLPTPEAEGQPQKVLQLPNEAVLYTVWQSVTGGDVECVVFSGHSKGGVSCNWENMR